MVAFKVHRGSQASSRVEAKNSALISSCDGYLLEPIEWLKGSQAYCGVLRDVSGFLSRPCKKEGSHLGMTGESHGFFKLRCDVWGFPRVTTGNSGSLSCAPGTYSLHLSCEVELGIALKSLQGK